MIQCACRRPVFGADVPLGAHIKSYLTPILMPLFWQGGPRSWEDNAEGLSRNNPCRELFVYF